MLRIYTHFNDLKSKSGACDCVDESSKFHNLKYNITFNSTRATITIMTKNDIGSYLGGCFSGVPTAAFNGTLKVANGAFAIFAGSSGGLCSELAPGNIKHIKLNSI